MADRGVGCDDKTLNKSAANEADDIIWAKRRASAAAAAEDRQGPPLEQWAGRALANCGEGRRSLDFRAEQATRLSFQDPRSVQFATRNQQLARSDRHHASVLPTRKQQQLGRPPQVGDGHQTASSGAADAPPAPSHVGATLATIHASPGKNL